MDILDLNFVLASEIQMAIFVRQTISTLQLKAKHHQFIFIVMIVKFTSRVQKLLINHEKHIIRKWQNQQRYRNVSP